MHSPTFDARSLSCVKHLQTIAPHLEEDAAGTSSAKRYLEAAHHNHLFAPPAFEEDMGVFMVVLILLLRVSSAALTGVLYLPMR